MKFSACAVSHSPALSTLKCAVFRSEWKSDRNLCSRSSRAFSEGAALSSREGSALPVPARLKSSKSRLTRDRIAEKSCVAVASMAAVTRSKRSEDCGEAPTAAGGGGVGGGKIVLKRSGVRGQEKKKSGEERSRETFLFPHVPINQHQLGGDPAERKGAKCIHSWVNGSFFLVISQQRV